MSGCNLSLFYLDRIGVCEQPVLDDPNDENLARWDSDSRPFLSYHHSASVLRTDTVELDFSAVTDEDDAR